jgi:hypothetical protein
VVAVPQLRQRLEPAELGLSLFRSLDPSSFLSGLRIVPQLAHASRMARSAGNSVAGSERRW